MKANFLFPFESLWGKVVGCELHRNESLDLEESLKESDEFKEFITNPKKMFMEMTSKK